MKKTQEFIGLPIIDISEGEEVGKVKNVIINADKAAIDFVVIDSGIQSVNTRVIPTERILGIGEYALTIESVDAVNDISKIPLAIDLLQKNILVKGTKVLTKMGRLIGETGDIYVDEKNKCEIVGVEYIADITQRKVRIIPKSSVITFGKNLVVVEDDVENKLLDEAANLDANSFSQESATIETNIYSQNQGIKYENKPVFETIENNLEINDMGTKDTIESEESEAIENEAIENEDIQEDRLLSSDIIEEDSDNQTASSLFEERQKQYLTGRKATKTITDGQGIVIINEGETITDNIIDEAKECGKLVELVMNNEA